MDQFIEMAAGKLGVDAGIVQKALGIVLNLIKDNADGSDFQSLLGSLPGAAALLDQGDGDSGGGGLLGAAAGALGGMMGGGGASLGALAQLNETGLDGGQVGSLLELFKGYATEQGGSDLVGRLVASVPGLDQLAG